MKVTIGPYLAYWGPFQIAEKLLFWLPQQKDEHGFPKRHDWAYALGHFFAFGSFDESKEDGRTWFDSLCEWVHSKRERTVVIKTDQWDHWNAHNTISMIALPVLRDLKEHKNSYGWIEDTDAPEHLSSIFAVSKDDGGWDSNNKARYDWVLNEIIWALEQDQPDCDWEDQYHTVKGDIDFKKYPEDEGQTCVPLRWNVEPVMDWDGYKKHQARISNGFRLFGKYYQTLWD